MSETETPAPVDLSRIQAAAGGDRGFERELFEIYLCDTEERLLNLELLLRQEDAAAFRREVHTVKGASASVGAAQMARLARTLEETAPNSEAGQALMRDLHAEFARLRVFLANYLAALG